MTAQKTALITAAGSGMGAAIARKLAADNYRVAILSSSGKGESLAAELGGFGMTGSNLNPDDLSRFVAASFEEFGRVDCVVNSAGHGPKGDLLEITDEQWHLGMDVYFLNVVRMCRLVTPLMLQARRWGNRQYFNIRRFRAGQELSHVRCVSRKPGRIYQAVFR